MWKFSQNVFFKLKIVGESIQGLDAKVIKIYDQVMLQLVSE